MAIYASVRHMKDIISVVIPSYNHADFLEQSVASVFSQDIPDLELIVIDDGSIDDSVKKLRDLSSLHKFKLICQENHGAHQTINRAIEQSSGKYVGILNSDDIYHDGRLKTLLEAAEKQNASFLYSAVTFINDKGHIITDHDRVGLYRKIWGHTSAAAGPEHFLAGNSACLRSGTIIKSPGMSLQLFRILEPTDKFPEPFDPFQPGGKLAAEPSGMPHKNNPQVSDERRLWRIFGPVNLKT
jgi:glycosyltransferase involved in cell wall biosynthesis